MSMKHLARWTFASLAQHFNDLAVANSIPIFIEGIHERDDALMTVSHVELRISGPFVKQVDSSRYTVDAIVNVMFMELMDMKGDAYQIVKWGGVFQDAFLSPLPVYKYGDGVDDDDSLIGCLRHKKNPRDQVKLFHFGQSDKTDRVRQSELDGLFDMMVSDADLA
jgi:hypothetical protein